MGFDIKEIINWAGSQVWALVAIVEFLVIARLSSAITVLHRESRQSQAEMLSLIVEHSNALRQVSGTLNRIPEHAESVQRAVESLARRRGSSSGAPVRRRRPGI